MLAGDSPPCGSSSPATTSRSSTACSAGTRSSTAIAAAVLSRKTSSLLCPTHGQAGHGLGMVERVPVS
jgi:hypothetical protein